MNIYGKIGSNIQQIGGDCPSGWVEMITERPDTKSVATQNGTWEYPTDGTSKSDRERARVTMNPIRDTFLNRLSGIAMFSTDEEVISECALMREALLDITKDSEFLAATTYEEMENSLLNAYRNIALRASTSIRNVFRELEV